MPRYAIVEAPSALGHVPEHLGVERAPEVLLGAGLADGLAARRAGRVDAAGYSAERDSGTQVMNPQAIRDYSPLLADAVTAALGEGEFPVVLGGDCSILLGTMLALRRRGRYGLLYIDGDADFYQPEVNPLNGAASASDLAFATGFGPDVVTDIEGRRPLVRAEDVVVFACRDAADRERRGCQPLPAGMLVIDRDQVRQLGAGSAVRQAVEYLTRPGGPEDGFWIHLDADVLDETIMQAVDDPRPGGLGWDELVSALSTAVHSGHAVGLQVAIYNPDIDADGTNGHGLAAAIREALAAPVAQELCPSVISWRVSHGSSVRMPGGSEAAQAAISGRTRPRMAAAGSAAAMTRTAWSGPGWNKALAVTVAPPSTRPSFTHYEPVSIHIAR
jgi:arginase